MQFKVGHALDSHALDRHGFTNEETYTLERQSRQEHAKEEGGFRGGSGLFRTMLSAIA